VGGIHLWRCLAGVASSTAALAGARSAGATTDVAGVATEGLRARYVVGVELGAAICLDMAGAAGAEPV